MKFVLLISFDNQQFTFVTNKWIKIDKTIFIITHFLTHQSQEKHLGFSHFQLNDVEEKRTKKNKKEPFNNINFSSRSFKNILFGSFSSNFFFSNQTNVPKTIYRRTFISSSLFDLIITFIFLFPFSSISFIFVVFDQKPKHF